MSSDTPKIAISCYGGVTRERIFVYKKGTYAWNIAWNNRNVTQASLLRPEGDRRGETVTEAAHCLYVGLEPRFSQDLAQPLHVDVDGALIDLTVAAPHLRQQLRPVERSATVRHQKPEQPILDAAKVHELAVRRHTVGRRIQDQFIAAKRRMLSLMRMAAQQRGNSRNH